MRQDELWHDSMEDAVRATVDAIGGPKHVAHELWPTRKMVDGARYLNHCLAEDRPEKLALGELLWIANEGRQKGVHTIMAYLSAELGYISPQPVEPEDERAQLQREFTRSVQMQRQLLNRLERLTS